MQYSNFEFLCRGLGCVEQGKTSRSDTANQYFLFCSQDSFRDANDLLYLRARYYKPDIGVFISEDPYEGSINEPMSLNRYAYVQGNPINKTDPSGMVVCSDLPFTGQGECIRKVNELYRDFRITLTEDEALSPQTKEHWISARLNNAYDAVQAIKAKLGGLTQQAIGGTELRLVWQSPGTEAAQTTRCDLLSLFLNLPNSSDHVHSVDNLIHEFGHVLTLSSPTGRTANSETTEGPASDMENRPVALWGQIQAYRGFGENVGWNTDERESSSDSAAEVVADMFLYWVQGYSFDGDTVGQARSRFMDGGDIPDLNGNPLTRPLVEGSNSSDGSVIRSAGIAAWARNASCSASAVPTGSALENDPYLLAANSGWCTFT
jgi:RHS repeat-associated protein